MGVNIALCCAHSVHRRQNTTCSNKVHALAPTSRILRSFSALCLCLCTVATAHTLICALFHTHTCDTRYVLANKHDIDALLKTLWNFSVKPLDASQQGPPQVDVIDVNGLPCAVLVFDFELRSDLPPHREKLVDNCIAQLMKMMRADGVIDEDDLKMAVVASWIGSVVVVLRATPFTFGAIFRHLLAAGEQHLALGDGVSLQSIRPMFGLKFESHSLHRAAFFDAVVPALKADGGEALREVTDAAAGEHPTVQRFNAAANARGERLQILVSCDAIERALRERAMVDTTGPLSVCGILSHAHTFAAS
jgi:hypothetical protein